MNLIFQPSVNLFKNGVIINYKKVGSRFMQYIASGPTAETDGITTENNRQVDFSFFSEDRGHNFGTNELQYKFFKRYVFSEWHWSTIEQENYSPQYKYKWNNDAEFFDEFNVKSYTDFFLNNKHDLIFLIRNPIDRFFSGMVQNLITYVTNVEDYPEEFSFFKHNTGFSDSYVSYLSELLRHKSPINFSKKISNENILKLFNYFLMHKWDLIRQDVHTEHYLIHFREMIYNIKEPSTFKIIDLSQLKTRKSYELLSELRGDNFPLEVYETDTGPIESNKSVYSMALEKYLNGELVQTSFGRTYSIIEDYLRYEDMVYNDLINSPYFINLED